MLLVDANVLLYATDERAVHHDQARRWLDRVLAAMEPVALAWSVLLAYVRVSTNPAVYERPLTVDEATEQLEAWLAAPGAIVVAPTPRHLSLLRGLLGVAGTAGNLVGDAHLAALALEHGATVVSYDRDFQRFEGLAHRLPD